MTTTVNLRAEAEAEARRLEVARLLDCAGQERRKSAFQDYARPTVAQAFRPANGRAGSPEGLRYGNFETRFNVSLRGNGPLIARTRGARRRKALAGRTLFIWQVACEDAAGRRSPETIVAFLATIEFVNGGGGVSKLRSLITAIDANPPDAMQRVLSATQLEIVDSVRAQAVARLERERAIAADVSRAPRPAAYQGGLFDRRSERNHERRTIDALHAEAAACGRVAAASAATTITALRPTLLLVLTAAS